MCTVIFSPRRAGYLLGMNRDEQLARVTARPPAHHEVEGRSVIYPAEPGGGTWIGLDDAGNCLALINWYAVRARMRGALVSRGNVVRDALPQTSADITDGRLRKMPLKLTRPFRLIGIFPGERQVIEWRWNHRSLKRVNHAWRPAIWISSGFDERGAQLIRQRVFQQTQSDSTFGGLPWLRRLHRSHEPKAGPYSICMHRAEAATVSYTEIAVNGRTGEMRYHDGPPCGLNASQFPKLSLRLGAHEVLATTVDD